MEHDVARRGGMRLNLGFVPSPPEVASEEKEAAHQATLEVVLQGTLEESQHEQDTGYHRRGTVPTPPPPPEHTRALTHTLPTEPESEM